MNSIDLLSRVPALLKNSKYSIRIECNHSYFHIHYHVLSTNYFRIALHSAMKEDFWGGKIDQNMHQQCLPHSFGGSKWCKKGLYSIFVIGRTKICILRCGFLPFLAKMIKFDIKNPKLIVINDFQHFLAHFEWFYHFFKFLM